MGFVYLYAKELYNLIIRLNTIHCLNFLHFMKPTEGDFIDWYQLNDDERKLDEFEDERPVWYPGFDKIQPVKL